MTLLLAGHCETRGGSLRHRLLSAEDPITSGLYACAKEESRLSEYVKVELMQKLWLRDSGFQLCERFGRGTFTGKERKNHPVEWISRCDPSGVRLTVVAVP